MSASIPFGDLTIGPGHPVVMMAELSANHNGDLGRALEIVDMAADAGAQAVKLQHYTADSLTIDSDAPPFIIGAGTPWEGRKLYELYEQAHMPWEWTEALFERARDRGIAMFSTPFDGAAVDLLEQFDPPAHKVASFELVDLGLIRRVAETGRPMIMSTGMATADEIDDAVNAARSAGAEHIGLMRCNSAYPAPPAQMDLRTIPDMAARWDVTVGLSDHTLSNTAAIAAVGLGATMVEKHVTISRDEPGPDSSFSLEPDELAALVTALREAGDAVGDVRYGPTDSEKPSKVFRRSLFAVRDIAAGAVITTDDVRSIRPGVGMAPKHLDEIVGRSARESISRGTPMSPDLLA